MNKYWCSWFACLNSRSLVSELFQFHKPLTFAYFHIHIWGELSRKFKQSALAPIILHSSSSLHLFLFCFFESQIISFVYLFI